MLHWAETGKKKVLITADFKLSLLKRFQRSLLTAPKIKAKTPSPSGGCVLREGQLYTLHLMVRD